MSSAFCFQLPSLRAKLLGPLTQGKLPAQANVRSLLNRTIGYALLSLLFIAPDANAQIRSGTITGLAVEAGAAITQGTVLAEIK